MGQGSASTRLSQIVATFALPSQHSRSLLTVLRAVSGPLYMATALCCSPWMSRPGPHRRSFSSEASSSAGVPWTYTPGLLHGHSGTLQDVGCPWMIVAVLTNMDSCLAGPLGDGLAVCLPCPLTYTLYLDYGFRTPVWGWAGNTTGVSPFPRGTHAPGHGDPMRPP